MLIRLSSSGACSVRRFVIVCALVSACGARSELLSGTRSDEHASDSTGGSGEHPASAGQAADRLGETVASALSTIADRFRDGAGSMGDGAAKFRSEAAKIGNNALRRLADCVEHRPLVTLAVAVGVGVLVGLAASHRPSHQPSHRH